MVPSWLAIALAVSQPIHLISVLIGNRPLDLLGWGSTALGFAAAGWALLRMDNANFEWLGPTPLGFGCDGGFSSGHTLDLVRLLPRALSLTDSLSGRPGRPLTVVSTQPSDGACT